MAIVHEFSWSTSRNRTFAECKRRYYWDYYGSWRGWERRAPEETRTAYLLKKMTRMPMWAGDCAHVALEWWFGRRTAGVTASTEETTERALQRFRRGYVESRDGLWKERPAKLTHLAEHHYAEAEIDEATGAASGYGKRYVDRIETGLAWFFAAPELLPVREAERASYLACEELGTIELFGSKVYAIPDFAFRLAGDERVQIYDWKTGRPAEADVFQLELYAHYAAQRWGVDPTAVTLVDAYLTDRELRAVEPGQAALDATLARVENSMGEMRALHFDADARAGDAAQFPQLEEGAAACGRCNYRELCGR